MRGHIDRLLLLMGDAAFCPVAIEERGTNLIAPQDPKIERRTLVLLEQRHIDFLDVSSLERFQHLQHNVDVPGPLPNYARDRPGIMLICVPAFLRDVQLNACRKDENAEQDVARDVP